MKTVVMPALTGTIVTTPLRALPRYRGGKDLFMVSYYGIRIRIVSLWSAGMLPRIESDREKGNNYPLFWMYHPVRVASSTSSLWGLVSMLTTTRAMIAMIKPKSEKWTGSGAILK